jgi:hypothetical protein
LRAALQRLGPAGVVALGVLLSCAVFYWSTVRPLERALDSQRRAAAMRQSTQSIGAASTDPRARELSRFQGLFPSSAELPKELDRLYHLARDADVEVARGEYRLENAGGPLLEYRVALPLRGRYAQVRNFLGATLAAMPGAAVDSLQFTRSTASETRIDAQLRLTLYFRPTAAGTE